MRKVRFDLSKILCLSLGGVVLFEKYSLAHEGHEPVSIQPAAVSWGLRGVMEMMNPHPLFVHFPIALLLVGVVFYILGSIVKKADLFIAGKWALFFGALGSGVAVWSGLQAAQTVVHDSEIHQIMTVHQYLGIGILVLSALLSLWLLIAKSNIPKQRSLFLSGLVVLSLMIVQTADFGGRMVYGRGVGVHMKSRVLDADRAPVHDHAADHRMSI